LVQNHTNQEEKRKHRRQVASYLKYITVIRLSERETQGAVRRARKEGGTNGSAEHGSNKCLGRPLKKTQGYRRYHCIAHVCGARK